MAQVEVKAADVVKLILQFLKENNLHESFDTLQRQSKTTLNTVNSLAFTAAVNESRWDDVLLQASSLMLDEEHLFGLYELVLDDLIEHDRFQAAEFIIKNLVRRNIRNLTNFRERLMRIQYILESPQEKALHRKPVTQQRKKEIVRQCLVDAHEEVENSRLLKLLTQAVKYQSQEGAVRPGVRLNLFEGRQKAAQLQQETIIKTVEKVVRYPEDAKITAMTLSWGEQYLALGGCDGLVEIYSTIDYSYHTGLKFQAEGTALFHDHPLTLLEFSPSDDILASADTSGLVKLWNMENGKLLRKIQSERGVGAVCWGLEPAHLLVAYQDVRLYGVRSCLVLKEYNMGGTDYVQKVIANEGRVYAVTNSGLLRIFSYATQQELATTNFRASVVAVLPIYTSRNAQQISRILVATAHRVFQVGSSGQQEGKHGVQNGELIGAACVGQYLYEFVRSDDKTCKMNVLSRTTGKNVYYCALDTEVGLNCMQRHKNLMITYDLQHQLNFWRQPN